MADITVNLKANITALKNGLRDASAAVKQTAGNLTAFSQGLAAGIVAELKFAAAARAAAQAQTQLAQATQKTTQVVQQQIPAMTSMIAKGTILADVFTRVATATFRFGKDTLDAMDALGDLSQRTGASVNNLSALQDVAQKNGIAFSEVESIVVKVNKELAKSTANSEFARALKVLGLDAAALRKEDPAVVVHKIALALRGYADDAQKARFIQEFLNLSQKDGAKFMEELAKQTALYGTTSAQAQADAAQFNDHIDELSANASKAARAVLTDLIPALNDLIKIFLDQGIQAAIAQFFEKIYGAKTFLISDQAEYATLKVNDLGDAIQDVAANIKRLEVQPFRHGPAIKEQQERLAALRKEQAGYIKDAAAASEKLKAMHPVWRMPGSVPFPTGPKLPSLPTLPGKPKAAKAPKKAKAEKEAIGMVQQQGDDAQRELRRMALKAISDAERLRDMRIDAAEDTALGEIDAIQQANDFAVEDGRMTVEQLLQADLDLEARRYKIRSDAIAQRMLIIKQEADAMGIDPNTLPEYQALLDAKAALDRKYLATVKDTQQAIKVEQQKVTEEIRTNTEGAFGTFFSDILNGTKSAKEAFDDLGKSILKMVMDLIAKKLAQRLMSSLFGDDKGSIGGLAGTIVSGIGGLFGGGKAEGGPVRAGKFYVVGEKGPELLQMGSRSGNIVPNKQLMGAVQQGAAAVQATPRLNFSISPEALNMTFKDWFEGQIMRIQANR